MKNKSKRYYANNYQAVSDTESEYFPSIPFDEFYAYHVANWMLPSSHECVIRTTSLKTGKVKEYSYKYRKAAQNKIKSLVHTHEFVVCDHESIHKLSPYPPKKTNDKQNRTNQDS
tara:strand:+ start:185 stop:529 length:345 start_codon:yes stop_codon:yes gene_type:complete